MARKGKKQSTHRKRKSKNSKDRFPKKFKSENEDPSSSEQYKPQSNFSENLSDGSDTEEETLLTTLRTDLGVNYQVIANSDEEEESDSENDSTFTPSLSKHGIEEQDSDIKTVLSDDNDEDVGDSCGEDEIENNCDPFMKHFMNELHPNLLESISASPPNVRTTTVFWPNLGELIIKIPLCSKTVVPQDCKTILGEEKNFNEGGQLPKVYNLQQTTLVDMHIKLQIVNNLVKIKAPEYSETKNGHEEFMTPLQNEIFSIINNYQDLEYTQRTFENAEDIRFVYCLHIVNHILKTRTKILNHNAKLADTSDMSDDYRDQGLVRPKVLVIVPFKESALKIISLLETILMNDDKGHVMNKKRFLEEYTGNEIPMPKKNPKPLDFQTTFVGNTSDDFKIGISITKKSLKLFADFYSADIIIGSPLGLRTVIGAEGESERNFDFLASIEILLLDQTEIFMMQNWDHLVHIFDHLHLQPKEFHGTDFSRVRLWCLAGQAKFYRQTLIFSSINLPEISSLFNKKCSNFAGYIKVRNIIETGSISRILVQLPHRFYKFTANNLAESIDKRFEFFTNNILPHHRTTQMRQTMIFISDYFDYVKLRNYFKKEMLTFTQICEYSKPEKVARARDMFFHGDACFMLYTERFHFYNRISLKGIRHIIFYSPPHFPHFYSELCNLMQEALMNKKIGHSTNMTVSVIYSKYDFNYLSAIVSSERAQSMLKSENNVHMMMLGG
ncbi:hypothetical protein HHI36_023230 [Cryptolaemus montrouzieri]|uniref:Digestive organ expansion factor homolog n=1 Tax=Cryptolaemus montrouzieri TaxID=559131 RepID=A0ABD2PGE2_9CUCU